MDWTGSRGRLLPFGPFLLAGSRGVPAPLGSWGSSRGFSGLRACLLSPCVLGHSLPKRVTGFGHLCCSVFKTQRV